MTMSGSGLTSGAALSNNACCASALYGSRRRGEPSRRAPDRFGRTLACGSNCGSSINPDLGFPASLHDDLSVSITLASSKLCRRSRRSNVSQLTKTSLRERAPAMPMAFLLRSRAARRLQSGSSAASSCACASDQPTSSNHSSSALPSSRWKASRYLPARNFSSLGTEKIRCRSANVNTSGNCGGARAARQCRISPCQELVPSGKRPRSSTASTGLAIVASAASKFGHPLQSYWWPLISAGTSVSSHTCVKLWPYHKSTC
mmetsp:Transcript_128284/g.371361  ORF Transcript_128284/g.371361 Transcript_128284/m.371361 type:complete len:260 (+) Transcript_128284:469-1248(+)